MDLFIVLFTLLAVFGGYVFFIARKYGIRPSISESWYELQKQKKGYLFTFFCWLLSASLISIGAILMGHGSSWPQVSLFYGAAAWFGFLGAAPDYRRKMDGIVHGLSATVGVLMAIAGLWMCYGEWWWLLIFGLYSVATKWWPVKAQIATYDELLDNCFTSEVDTIEAVVLTEIRHYTWWQEIAAFAIIWTGLFIHALILAL